MAPVATDFSRSNSSAEGWSAAQSAELYGLNTWGAPWLDIKDNGTLCFRAPLSKRSQNETFTPPVEIEAVLQDLFAKGLRCPLSLHWTNVLEHMAVHLFSVWDKAREEHHYEAPFRGVLPMKVNCLNGVAPVLLKQQPRLGIECGTLAELLLAIGLLDDSSPPRMLIVNGFKSPKFIEATLRASQLPVFNPTIIVFDRVADVRIFKDAATKLNILPHGLGVRARLATQGAGKHASSSGAGSKFGMSAGELVHVVETLKQKEGLLNLLTLLHFHIGSQVSQIKALEGAFREGANLYCELRELGATSLDTIDVGGGLAVRYDNTQASDSSADYDWQVYASTAVREFGDVCAKRGHPKPAIVTESGRALTAHHSMVIFDVEDTVSMSHGPADSSSRADQDENRAPQLRELHKVLQSIDAGRQSQGAEEQIKELQGALHESFCAGKMSLKERSEGDSLAQAALDRLQCDEVRRAAPTHQAMSNVSYFQSLNHVWTLGGIFPTVPLQDLDQRPDIRAVLTDLTCDSLGVMQNFQALGSSKADSKSAGFLPLHSRPQSPTHPYRVAVCFTGAYNALLNGRHNLFGETDSAGVRVGDNGYTIEWTRSGSSVGDMLRGIGYDTADLEGNVSRLSKAGGIVDKQDWYHKALQEATYPS